jgi:hypothetical protein
MTASPARTPAILATLILAGAFGWLVFTAVFHDTWGQDWMVSDTAARAYWRGDVAMILDDRRLMPAINADHPSLLVPVTRHPWVYPPNALLLALPFGLVPWWFSYGGFIGLSFAAMAASLRLWFARTSTYLWALAGVTLSPAAAYTFGAGQNSFLSAALLLGGFWHVGRRPVVAGVLLGLLAYKPQLGVLIPVALIAAGAWRSVAAATATVIATLLFTLAVPGPTLWRGFLHLYLGGAQTPRLWVELYGQSMFTYLRLAGASMLAANAGQGVALVIGAAAVWRACRQRFSALRRMAILLTAVSFAAPHFGDYDAILLCITAMLLLLAPAGEQATQRTAILATLAWASTAINPPYLFKQTIPFLFPIAEATPLIILALLICLLDLRPFNHSARVAPAPVPAAA